MKAFAWTLVIGFIAVKVFGFLIVFNFALAAGLSIGAFWLALKTHENTKDDNKDLEQFMQFCDRKRKRKKI